MLEIFGMVSEGCVKPAYDHSLGIILACDYCSAWHEPGNKETIKVAGLTIWPTQACKHLIGLTAVLFYYLSMSSGILRNQLKKKSCIGVALSAFSGHVSWCRILKIDHF